MPSGREFAERDEQSSTTSPGTQQAEAGQATPGRDAAPVRDTPTQAQLSQARAYKEQIDHLLKSRSNQPLNTRLQDLAGQVDDWLKAIEALARRIDGFHQNRLIQRDLDGVPEAIEKLEARLAAETDRATRTELESALAGRRNQLLALEQLQSTISRAEIKIENTVSTLGTIYSQLLTAQSTDQVADYSRLASEADEEVRTLQDYLEALEEVKLDNM